MKLKHANECCKKNVYALQILAYNQPYVCVLYNILTMLCCLNNLLTMGMLFILCTYYVYCVNTIYV